MEREENEILRRAAWQRERNEKILERRAETVEEISKMSEEERLAYYKRIEKENDAFLQTLGIKRADISTQAQSSEERDNAILESIRELEGGK